MQYFVLEPEVAGGWGDNTQADVSVHPPIVKRLHYKFDGWLGDSILETFPCFIVTVELGSTLKEKGLTGFVLDSVEISKSEQFLELSPERKLPEFYWLRVGKNVGIDDFGVDYRNVLVVSSTALEALREYSLNHCDIKQYG